MGDKDAESRRDAHRKPCGRLVEVSAYTYLYGVLAKGRYLDVEGRAQLHTKDYGGGSVPVRHLRPLVVPDRRQP
jgi:hypothetical protein